MSADMSTSYGSTCISAEALQAIMDKRMVQSGRKPQWHTHLQRQLKGYVDALTKPHFAEESIACLRMFSGEALEPHALQIIKAARDGKLHFPVEALALLGKLDDRTLELRAGRLAELLTHGSPDVRYGALCLLSRLPAERLLRWQDAIGSLQPADAADAADAVVLRQTSDLAARIMNTIYAPGTAGFRGAQAEFKAHGETSDGRPEGKKPASRRGSRKAQKTG